MSLFADRHIGPDLQDQAEMLETLGTASLEALMDEVVPKAIRTKEPIPLAAAKTEAETLAQIRDLADTNQVFTSLIGQGYYGTIMPAVIRRNILESPAWYTAYTPYQPEISQGRLELLLAFQTMVCELTGMDLANASLLDEATAAGEAMTLLARVSKSNSLKFGVEKNTFPQTKAVLETRAIPLGIELMEFSADEGPPENCFGVFFQQPTSSGKVLDLGPLIKQAHQQDSLVGVSADLLALCLITPPGELGADAVVGTTQRFGVPMGFGGPHAAYIAVRESYQRALPGRLVGVSKDSQGNKAYRLALQTREQHIRREKATSNICTAQVLLAIISALYAAYHGPKGLQAIAENTHQQTSRLAEAMCKAGLELAHNDFFDTLFIKAGGKTDKILKKALDYQINLLTSPEGCISISLDEATTEKTLSDLCEIFDLTELPETAAPAIPGHLRRKTEPLTNPVFTQNYSEAEFTRYLKRLADKDLALDRSMIPLGSCTMKLNSAAELEPISWPEFANIHPFTPANQVQGYMKLLDELSEGLKAVTKMPAVSLQPNAGSQGELAGLLAIRAYHANNSQPERKMCLIPASAHGTNAASAVMAGMEVRIVGCDQEGNVDLADLTKKLEEHSKHLAALMITYPSTHGVFETQIQEICELVHTHGGQVYMDGANLNALIGLAYPGDFGADVSHLNLHKTFCIPHGGGGPGVGPLVAARHLEPFLPGHPFAPELPNMAPVSAAPYGSAGILPISWAYLQMMGAEGLAQATQIAILNANYLSKQLSHHYPILYTGQSGRVAHECILDLRGLREFATVEDVAKRLMDYGFHAPTVSFPVEGTLMVEPTESESKAEMDRFIGAMASIREEIHQIETGAWDKDNNPLKLAPHTAEEVISDSWDRPYSRELAAYPAPHTRESKYWPPVSRIDSAWGDRNLFCSCPILEA